MDAFSDRVPAPDRSLRLGLTRVRFSFLLLGLLLTSPLVFAQPQAVPARRPGEAPMVVPGGTPPGAPGQPPGAPGQPGAPNAGKPAEGAPATPSAPPPVARPAQPKQPANQEELRQKPSPDGKLQLNFQGQKWLDVLEWYADVAGLSLDWQELPGDFLNLRTQRSYTVAEIRDVLNRHLMERGYTLLRNGEVLIVANLKRLDPALVPRVMPEDLAHLQPHEFVKTSFKLDWLIAESTVEELKPLLSPHGKIWAMKATNRIEAIDAVSNLQAVATVLLDEQSGSGQERLVREFRLQYARADEVYDLLLGLLGKEKPKKDEGPMDPRRMMQMQQQMQQMQQMQQQQQGQKPAMQKPGEVHLVVNRRENSVLVNGPPDQVAIIEQAVKQLDVPSLAGQSLLQNPTRMQIYRLASIDPEPLVETLTEIGNLDPQTQLRIDKKNRSIIAYASLADHVTIKALVEKLDGSDRRFEVIRLRKLEADYVAGSIQFMMGEADASQQQPRRSYYYYDPFSAGSGGSGEETATRKFRVDADIEHNRLLIWANDVELAEIQNLLIKLGELPPQGSRGSTLRAVDGVSDEDMPYLLERLREAWPSESAHPLQIRIAPPKKDPAPRAPTAPNTSLPAEPKTTTTSDGPISLAPSQPPLFRFSPTAVSRTQAAQASIPTPATMASPETLRIAQVPAAERVAAPDRAELPETVAPVTPGSPAPVIIELTAEGRWLIRSEDPAALDRLEDLLMEMSPPRRDYKLFQLKHSTSWAYGISLTLEEFFKEQEEKPASRRSWFWGGDDGNSSNKDKTRRLSQRRPLKFIADSDSNTILVVGADPQQLRTIEELINYYDQPVASDAKALRRTEILHLEYADASVLAETIKDVYRDLLSENDKALQQQNGQNANQQRQSEKTVTYVYDSFGDEGGDKKGSDPPAPVRFKGALSVGVDEVSNSLVISSTENLLASIKLMVAELDQAARPKTPTMQVLQLNRSVPVDVVQEKLAKLLKERRRPQRPQNQNPQQPGQPQQPNVQPADEDRP